MHACMYVCMYVCIVWRKILMGENIDEFDKFPTIRQYIHYQNFTFSHLSLKNLWRSGQKLNYISEAPPRVTFFTATAQGLLWFPISCSQLKTYSIGAS